MSSITHHRNKKTGAVYAYKVESYWDKEKKAPRNKQTSLGRVDPETGEIIPSKRNRKVIERASGTPGVTASSRVAGPHLLLEQLSRKLQLDKLFEKCFGEDVNLTGSAGTFFRQDKHDIVLFNAFSERILLVACDLRAQIARRLKNINL